MYPAYRPTTVQNSDASLPSIDSSREEFADFNGNIKAL